MNLTLLKAPLELRPIIQNMARFYVYDLSKYCGNLPDWELPEDGLYECYDLSQYWQEQDRYPFIIKIDDEWAGFVLVNTLENAPNTRWNMAEFFILGKFQRKGIGKKVAIQIFEQFKGQWEVAQMPDNLPAIQFWKKVIAEYTNGCFLEDHRKVVFPIPHEMNLLKFDNRN